MSATGNQHDYAQPDPEAIRLFATNFAEQLRASMARLFDRWASELDWQMRRAAEAMAADRETFEKSGEEIREGRCRKL